VEDRGGARVVHVSPALSTADVDRNRTLNCGYYCTGENCAVRVRNFAAPVGGLSFDKLSVYRSMKRRQSSPANVGLTMTESRFVPALASPSPSSTLAGDFKRALGGADE
jgi:hypothetical protein